MTCIFSYLAFQALQTEKSQRTLWKLLPMHQILTLVHSFVLKIHRVIWKISCGTIIYLYWFEPEPYFEVAKMRPQFCLNSLEWGTTITILWKILWQTDGQYDHHRVSLMYSTVCIHSTSLPRFFLNYTEVISWSILL